MNIWPCLKRTLAALLTAAAVILGVLIQLIVVLLLCSVFPDGIATWTVLISPFAIGVGSYFIYRRVTGRRAVREESQRWLNERSRSSTTQRARMYQLKHIAVWVPTFVVAISFPFAPELFGVATHVLYGRLAVLNGYEVHRPITSMVFDAAFPGSEDPHHAAAFDFRGPLRSRFRGFLGLYPQASNMLFSDVPDRDSVFPANQKLGSVRTIPLADESLQCIEYDHSQFVFDEEHEGVECRSASGRFFASFYGDKDSVTEFYETLQHVRRLTTQP